jgi:hypothetical protein
MDNKGITPIALASSLRDTKKTKNVLGGRFRYWPYGFLRIPITTFTPIDAFRVWEAKSLSLSFPRCTVPHAGKNSGLDEHIHLS